MDYVRFANTIEEAITTGNLERAPLLVPVQHVPSEASPKTFLDFDERHTVTMAMEKLSRTQEPNLKELFKVSDHYQNVPFEIIRVNPVPIYPIIFYTYIRASVFEIIDFT